MTRRAHDVRGHGAGPRGETGSMAMYLMFAIMGMALGALIVPMIITQARTTRSDTSRVHALDAAQAGLNVMVGRIRARPRLRSGDQQAAAVR